MRINDDTRRILRACDRAGVARVGIHTKDHTFKDSQGHPLGSRGSIFLDGRKDGWPKAWWVAERSGLSWGAGNSGQHQISGDAVEGIYERRADGWYVGDARVARWQK